MSNFFKKNKHFFKKKDSLTKKEYFLLNNDSPFVITEAFRNLKANICVSVPKKKNNEAIRIFVTSAEENDGKTVVSVNMAYMMACSSARVLLIDADIRKGRVHKFFSNFEKIGLSDYLCGQVSLDRIIHQSEENEFLHLMFCGSQAPNPYELLESSAMREMVEELSSQYDYIIFDAPPLEVVSDCLNLVPLSDGCVVVTRYHSTTVSVLRSALNRLAFSKAKILGLVLNDFMDNDTKKKAYMRGYHYSYKYAYQDHPNTMDRMNTTDKNEDRK